MSDSKPVIAITLSLALLTGYLTLSNKRAPESSRPRVQAQTPEPALIGDQVIPARLWQDPMDAQQKEFADRFAASHLQAQVSRRKTKALAVTVEGHSYPEDKEARRRMRFAVQKALESQGYVPSDRGNLGVIMAHWPEVQEITDPASFVNWVGQIRTYKPKKTGPVLSIPFEWFDPPNTNAPAALVLWVREEYVADKPLLRLAAIYEAVFSAAPEKADSFNVLGPRSSNTLKEFLSPSACTNVLATFKANLKIFSCQATVIPTSALATSFETNVGPNILVNCIAPDSMLIPMLFAEMENRLRAHPNTKDKIALFHESDTSYGRNLARLFQNEANSTNNRWIPSVFPYLRGVDGTLASGAEEKTKDSEDGRREPTRMEKAEEDHQLDYIRRIARRLKDDNDNAKSSGDSVYRAIGIVGSDLYDKLLLLQALRAELPDVVYFTTDLDARLLHANENAWARNLVVASAFPLSERDSPMPEMRDSYQTALYTACVKALRDDFAPPELDPGLWEVSRTKLVRLKPADSPLHRALLNGSNARLWGQTVLAIVSCLFFYIAARAWMRKATGVDIEDTEDCERRKSLLAEATAQRARWSEAEFDAAENAERARATSQLWNVIVAAFYTMLILLVVTWVFSQMPGEEPFDPSLIFEGVIVWPSEWMRAIIILFCVGSVIWAYWTYRLGLYSVLRDYKFELLPRKPEPAVASAGNLRQRVDAFRRRYGISSWAHSTDDNIHAEVWLMEYQQRGHLKARVFRSLFYGILFAGFCLALLAMDGLRDAPARGWRTILVDRALFFLLIIALFGLMAYIVDVIRLTARLIRRLGDGTTIWPEKLRNQWAKDTGLHANHVGGLIDVEFVARHTARVNVAAFLPFVALALAGLARISYFDRWNWPIGLQFFFVAYGLCAFACAWAVRSAANQVREEAIASLRKLHLASPDTAPPKRVEALIAQVEEKRGGAYNQWWADPAVIGVLITPGSAGAFNLLKNLFLN